MFSSSSNNPSSSSGTLFGGFKPSGNSNSFNTSTPQTNTANLFGSTSNSQPTASLFSSNSNNSNPQSGLFGSNTNISTNTQLNSTTTSGNLFGNSQVNPTNLNNSFTNQSTSLPVTPVPSGVNNGVSQSNSVFTRTTRFNDLPDDAKKQLEMLDTMIQTQCRHSDNLKSMQLGTEIAEGTSLLRKVTSEMHATSASVTTSLNLLDSIRQAIDTDVVDLLKLAAIVDAHLTQRLAVGAHNPPESTPNPIKFQHEFFSQKCAEMDARLKRYRQTIEFVEVQLKGLFDRPSPASIVPALKAQYSTFMALADKVAQLNTSLMSLKEGYREIWRHQTGSVRDPFAEVDRVFAGGNISLANSQTC